MNKNKIGVHTRHCCADHGCKYGDDDCPVALGTHKQEYPCEYCGMDADERPYQIEKLERKGYTVLPPAFGKANSTNWMIL